MTRVPVHATGPSGGYRGRRPGSHSLKRCWLRSWTLNPADGGSIPPQGALPTRRRGQAHRACTSEVAGSSPAVGSMPVRRDGWRTRFVIARMEFESPRWLNGDVAHQVEHRLCIPDDGVRVPASPRRSCPGSPNGRGAALRTRRLGVRIPLGVRRIHGGAEQRSARDPVKVETAGSNPVVTAHGGLAERLWQRVANP
jgi:hypothetical protein